MNSQLTITSPIEDKIAKAKDKFLVKKEFSPSRLNSWQYVWEIPPFSEKEDPTKEEVLNSLLSLEELTGDKQRRMSAGFELENAVSDFLKIERQNKCNPASWDIAKPVCEYIKKWAIENGVRKSWLEQQVKMSMQIEIEGFGDIIMNGYADMIWFNKVFDFKYTEALYNYGKYRNSFQHMFYLLYLKEKYDCEYTFEYLIAKNGNLFVEEYRWKDFYIYKIKNTIKEILNFVDSL